MTATVLTALITHRFTNGAIKAKADGIEFGIDHKGRIYWANDEGWARIATDRTNFPATSHKASWGEGFHFNDDQYRFAGQLVDAGEDAPSEDPAGAPRPTGGMTKRRTTARARWVVAARTIACRLATAALNSRITAMLRRAGSDLTAYTADQLAKALELIEDDAIHPLRGRVWLAVSTDGSRVYRVATSGQCTCPSGLKTWTAKPCYHALAAQLLAAA